MRRGKGSPIAKILEERGLTAEQLAAEAGISMRTTRRWVARGTRLQRRCQECIAVVLGMDPLSVGRPSWQQRVFVEQGKTRIGLFAGFCFFLRVKRLSPAELEAAELDLELLDFIEAEAPKLRQRLTATASRKRKRSIRNAG